MIIKVLHLLGWVPLPLRALFGYSLGKLFGYLPLRDQRITRLQLAKILFQHREPDRAMLRLTAQVFGHFGQVASEMLNLAPLLPGDNENSKLEVNDEELLKELKRAPGPILALTAHTGNWELMAADIAKRGFQLVAVAREARVAPFQEFLRTQRARFGIETIWRGGMTAQKELVRAFQAGKTVAALIDQDTYVDGLFSPFFGLPAKTPSALVELALRSNARIVTAFCARSESGTYKLEIQTIPHGYSTQEILDIYHARLESVIRRCPDQWVWFHKRWRTLPSGKRLGSEDYERFLIGMHANSSSAPSFSSEA